MQLHRLNRLAITLAFKYTTSPSVQLFRGLPGIRGLIKSSSMGGSRTFRGYAANANVKTFDHKHYRVGVKVFRPFLGHAIYVEHGLWMGAVSFGLGTFLRLVLTSPHDDKYSYFWMLYLREVGHSFFTYYGWFCILTATITQALKTGKIMRLAFQRLYNIAGGVVSAALGTCEVASIQYEPRSETQNLGCFVRSGIVGAFLAAPSCLFGGYLLLRGTTVMATVIGTTSTIIAYSVSQRLLKTPGPMAIIFVLLIASTIAAAAIPPSTVLGSLLFTISTYSRWLGPFLAIPAISPVD